MESKCHWATKTDEFYLTFDMHHLGVYEDKIMINKVLSLKPIAKFWLVIVLLSKIELLVLEKNETKLKVDVKSIL